MSGRSPGEEGDHSVNSENGFKRYATYRCNEVVLDTKPNWPEGTKLIVTPVFSGDLDGPLIDGKVIVAGFGLAGRFVADLLDSAEIPYTVIEVNEVTVETQRALNRDIIHGNATSPEMLTAAGLSEARVLALTIPDEDAVLQATELARKMNPDIYIIARTNYSSKGMRCSQLGANEVVKAEHAVALQFYERLSQFIRRSRRRARESSAAISR